MKFNFILLAIVLAFVICYFFTVRDVVKEGQRSVKLADHRFAQRGDILSGYEDILIGIGDDYKLYSFNNEKKQWKEIAGKSCCVRDLAYWNNTLLGVGKYDHRLYRWQTTGLKSGLWKLADELPNEWMNTIGVWKNQLFSANKTSVFRWSGIADGRQNTPFKSKSLNKPSWHWSGVKVVKNMAEYNNNLYIIDRVDRLEMLVDGHINARGKLLGQWKRVGQPTEALIAIAPWNDKLMGLGTDKQLYQWNDQRQNWFKKHTDKKLISIIALDPEDYKKLFNPTKKRFNCADGFKIEPKEQKRCYRAEGEELTWEAAAQKCKQADPDRKTTLAVITSGNENNFVKDLMNYPKWIGCSDKEREGVWKWPNGKTLEENGYSNWGNAEPNNSGEGEHYCEQYSSGLWNDAGPPKNFNAKKPYVCSHCTSQKEGFVGTREGFREGIDSWVKCADEGGKCKCSGKVRYGKKEKWGKILDVNGEIQCNNYQKWGDPLFGVRKECQCNAVKKSVPEKGCKSMDGRYPMGNAKRYTGGWALSNGEGDPAKCKILCESQPECKIAGQKCKSKAYPADNRCYCSFGDGCAPPPPAPKAVPKAAPKAAPKISEITGDYDVYYRGVKRTGPHWGGRGLQVTCDGVATQPGVFVDKIHTKDMAEKCKGERDSQATFYITKTHGANKHECLRKEGDKIVGNHYINNGDFWGAVEYRPKANQDAKYDCNKPAPKPPIKAPMNVPMVGKVFPKTPPQNSIMLVGDDWLTVSRNQLVKQINIDRDYRLEFTIMPTGKIPGWSNILHSTLTGANCCAPGDRMPGIWFFSNTTRMHIRSGDQSCGNCGIDPPVQLPLNKETRVVVEMNAEYMTVAYTGAISHKSTIKRGVQRPTGKAHFFVSDNFYNAAQARVKNMKWTNATNPPLPKNTVTCRFTAQNVVDSVKYNNKDIEFSGDPKKWESPKTVTFEADPKKPGNLTITASSGHANADGCKNAGLLMSCEAGNGNPWNNFGTNTSHWAAVGKKGKIFRSGNEIPCESVSGVGMPGNKAGKAIWSMTGQQTVEFVGGPRTEPEVSCPKDFQGLPLKVLRWGKKLKDGGEILHTEGGDLNIPSKDVIKLKGSKVIRIWAKQPPKGSWTQDNIEKRKISSNGTLYLKTVYNPQWIRIPNEKRTCFKETKSIFITQGELLSAPNNGACTGGLKYILHSKGSLCPKKIGIKTKLECEKAVASLGLGERDAGRFPWKNVNSQKFPAGCSWTSKADEKGGPMAFWNAVPNVSGNPRRDLHPICYSKAPAAAALELIQGQGCKACPAGTYSVEGSKECIVCTKNSTNPQCKEGGRSGIAGKAGDAAGLVCPAGTSSTGAIIAQEGKPMSLGDDQSTPNSECPAKKVKQKCSPECNKTYGRCISGMCVCGAGYTGPTCDEPPKAPPKTLEEWKAEYEAKKAMLEAREDANKPEAISYGYHEHKKMQGKFTNNLKALNDEIQDLVVQARQGKDKKKRQRSFLPSEFLAWSQAIPGLLGKTFDKKLGPKPIDVGIAIDDRRKIHFRQQTNKSGDGKDTNLQAVNAKPQVIKGDVQPIAKGGDLKGHKSFENPKPADYKGYNDDKYLKKGNKPIQKVG